MSEWVKEREREGASAHFVGGQSRKDLLLSRVCGGEGEGEGGSGTAGPRSARTGLSERAGEAMSTTDSERAEKSECVRACVLAWHSE